MTLSKRLCPLDLVGVENMVFRRRLDLAGNPVPVSLQRQAQITVVKSMTGAEEKPELWRIMTATGAP